MAHPWTTFIPQVYTPAEIPVVTGEPPRKDGRLERPTTRAELRAWCLTWLGIDLPVKGVCEGHNTPLEYLDYVFFERGDEDALIHACRGGGKTQLGAVATLLDMLFKPGIEIRILGGSVSQAERMYEHLVRMVDHGFRDRLCKHGKLNRITRTGFRFANGSRVEILSPTESSVRGARVQKVRCDEVDLFDRKIWEAIQLTTRSKQLNNGIAIRGSIETFSTMNDSRGLMSELLSSARYRVFRWCVWDVAQNCQQNCATCTLEPDCKGCARSSQGFIPISDLRVLQSRVSARTWSLEMLCDLAKARRSGVAVRFY